MAAARAALCGRIILAAIALHTVATATLSPATALNARITVPGDRGQARTIAPPSSMKTGPYKEWTCCHWAAVTWAKGS